MLKQSYKQYRNIKGKHFVMWTSNPAEFDQAKAEIKKQGLSFRVIDGQLYKEIIDPATYFKQ